MPLKMLICSIFVFAFCTTSAAQTVRSENGGDMFVSGRVVSETLNVDGDTFVAAQTAVTRGSAGGDLHVAGFHVTVNANTDEDVYAAGATVVIDGAVAKDLSAAGFSVRTGPNGRVTGNARLAGGTVIIEGPINGSLSVTGGEVQLNAPIAGEVRIVARQLTFGPEATVAGTLTYSVKTPISVPERVAPPERVNFEPMDTSDLFKGMSDMREMPMLPGFATMLFGFLVSLAFFMVLGVIVLTYAPNRLEEMRTEITAAPGRTLIFGVTGLSILFGAVLVTGLTIVGLPFVPIAVLAIIVTWTLGYALGAYAVAMRLWQSFDGDPDPKMVTRLLVFAAAIAVVALTNFIPFVGWVINYTLVLLGLGAITRAIFRKISSRGQGTEHTEPTVNT